MKTLLIRAVMTVFLGLAVASMPAQTQSTTSNSTTYIEASKIVGNRVKSSDGQEIGTIKDVVLDRNTGCMAYTVVSSAGGGAGAPSGKMVAVPWAVYSPTSDVSELTVSVDREKIYNAPVFDYARIDEYSRPEYITNVYSYYGVSPGAAVGVGVSGSTTTGATRATGTTGTTGAASGTSTREGTNPGRTHTAAAPSTRGRSETGSRSENEPSRHEGAGQAEGGNATRESRSEREQSRPEGASQPEGGNATRESSAGREQSRPEGASQAEGGNATRESSSEREQSRPEGAGQAEEGNATRESRSGREQSQPEGEGAAQSQTQTRRHHREKTGKQETSSPPERPEGE